MLRRLYFLLFTSISLSAFSTTITVSNVQDTGTGSFRASILLANDDDTIRFSPALLALGNDTITLQSTVLIDKRIVVKGLFLGNDTLFISGNQLVLPLAIGFAFNYAGGLKNVVLDSLAIINGGTTTNSGGSINVGYRLDTLTINNCLFRDGVAPNGAGIYGPSTTSSTAIAPFVFVANSTFEHNAASNFGGAICTYFPKFYISNSSFVGNSAGRGGGIYFHSEDRSELDNCTFDNNDASLYGGGFYVHFTDTVRVSNSLFTRNYAFYNGGGLNSVGRLEVHKTVVDSNIAGTRGGGLYCAYFSTTAYIDSSLFTRNHATFGGGVHGRSAMDFSYTTVSNNTGSQGAGLYFVTGTVNVHGCTFFGNVGSSGGAINANQNGTLNVSNTTITNNTASGFGGGIYSYSAYNNNSFSLKNSTITANTGGFGSGIAFRTSSTHSLNASFESSIVAGNGPVDIRLPNDTITSLGFNVFGDSTIYGSIPSDQLFVNDSMLSLRPLGNYGGFMLTAPPNIGSIVIDNGNPLDTSFAQNGPVNGIRDAGSAEGRGVYHDTLVACTQVDWYGSSYSVSGDYLNVLPGGDTVAALNLTIIPFTTGTDVITACSSYTWTNGVTYTANNTTATDTLVNITGCDSIVTLNLTIIQSTLGVETVAACDSFIWNNGITYTASTNTPTDTLISALGCDSIVNLNLIIQNSKSGIDVIASCDPITWINGVTYSASNSTAKDTLATIHGCDSVVTLNYTRLTTSSGIDQVLACKSYTWIDGNTYTANNNTATDTLVNSAGCDSVVTLNLTIHNVTVTVTENHPTLTADAAFATSYQWLDCNNGYAIIPGETGQSFTASLNGNYAVEVTELGCVDTSNCYLVSNISLEEDGELSQIEIYPNPAVNELNIRNMHLNVEKRLSLINELGQVIWKGMTTSTEITIPLEDIPPGLYTIGVHTTSGMISEKVIIHRGNEK